jgi:hypothetical protein
MKEHANVVVRKDPQGEVSRSGRNIMTATPGMIIMFFASIR